MPSRKPLKSSTLHRQVNAKADANTAFYLQRSVVLICFVFWRVELFDLGFEKRARWGIELR